ncbi:Beige/BEACH domain containing protein [Trichomonas vaginalis G3]|uniref:Beige/BEACH domain containing protein n=1 Tax=Trichomonas vaginalis (strain ATCC PRA-98 / G3) TaxID=412133 RepID=A2EQR0_TRIV3|nr:aggrephagy protein [Trichomonas vaginalis G3]EAY05025.1 Beige/BEACH domain containing protein [Trichomonas vaginalis G3]KAI5502933.1 aggrephagy protein [Trichomonas vaginalis G3]|eukprot:XP_001317248.1 Beige/BEACH domain containing protein [Trichomonas vaginalis G3]
MSSAAFIEPILETIGLLLDQASGSDEDTKPVLILQTSNFFTEILPNISEKDQTFENLSSKAKYLLKLAYDFLPTFLKNQEFSQKLVELLINIINSKLRMSVAIELSSFMKQFLFENYDTSEGFPDFEKLLALFFDIQEFASPFEQQGGIFSLWDIFKNKQKVEHSKFLLQMNHIYLQSSDPSDANAFLSYAISSFNEIDQTVFNQAFQFLFNIFLHQKCDLVSEFSVLDGFVQLNKYILSHNQSDLLVQYQFFRPLIQKDQKYKIPQPIQGIIHLVIQDELTSIARTDALLMLLAFIKDFTSENFPLKPTDIMLISSKCKNPGEIAALSEILLFISTNLEFDIASLFPVISKLMTPEILLNQKSNSIFKVIKFCWSTFGPEGATFVINLTKSCNKEQLATLLNKYQELYSVSSLSIASEFIKIDDKKVFITNFINAGPFLTDVEEFKAVVADAMFNNDLRLSVIMETVNLKSQNDIIQLIFSAVQRASMNPFIRHKIIEQNILKTVATLYISGSLSIESIIDLILTLSGHTYNQLLDLQVANFVNQTELFKIKDHETFEILAFDNGKSLIFPSLIHLCEKIVLRTPYDIWVCAQFGLENWMNQTGRSISEFPQIKQLCKHYILPSHANMLLDNPHLMVESISEDFSLTPLFQFQKKLQNSHLNIKLGMSSNSGLSLSFWFYFTKLPQNAQVICNFMNNLLCLKDEKLNYGDKEVAKITAKKWHNVIFTLTNQLKLSLFMNSQLIYKSQHSVKYDNVTCFSSFTNHVLWYIGGCIRVITRQISENEISKIFKKGVSNTTKFIDKEKLTVSASTYLKPFGGHHVSNTQNNGENVLYVPSYPLIHHLLYHHDGNNFIFKLVVECLAKSDNFEDFASANERKCIEKSILISDPSPQSSSDDNSTQISETNSSENLVFVNDSRNTRFEIASSPKENENLSLSDMKSKSKTFLSNSVIKFQSNSELEKAIKYIEELCCMQKYSKTSWDNREFAKHISVLLNLCPDVFDEKMTNLWMSVFIQNEKVDWDSLLIILLDPGLLNTSQAKIIISNLFGLISQCPPPNENQEVDQIFLFCFVSLQLIDDFTDEVKQVIVDFMSKLNPSTNILTICFVGMTDFKALITNPTIQYSIPQKSQIYSDLFKQIMKKVTPEQSFQFIFRVVNPEDVILSIHEIVLASLKTNTNLDKKFLMRYCIENCYNKATWAIAYSLFGNRPNEVDDENLSYKNFDFSILDDLLIMISILFTVNARQGSFWDKQMKFCAKILSEISDKIPKDLLNDDKFIFALCCLMYGNNFVDHMTCYPFEPKEWDAEIVCKKAMLRGQPFSDGMPANCPAPIFNSLILDEETVNNAKKTLLNIIPKQINFLPPNNDVTLNSGVFPLSFQQSIHHNNKQIYTSWGEFTTVLVGKLLRSDETLSLRSDHNRQRRVSDASLSSRPRRVSDHSQQIPHPIVPQAKKIPNLSPQQINTINSEMSANPNAIPSMTPFQMPSNIPIMSARNRRVSDANLLPKRRTNEGTVPPSQLTVMQRPNVNLIFVKDVLAFVVQIFVNIINDENMFTKLLDVLVLSHVHLIPEHSIFVLQEYVVALLNHLTTKRMYSQILVNFTVERIKEGWFSLKIPEILKILLTNLEKTKQKVTISPNLLECIVFCLTISPENNFLKIGELLNSYQKIVFPPHKQFDYIQNIDTVCSAILKLSEDKSMKSLAITIFNKMAEDSDFNSFWVSHTEEESVEKTKSLLVEKNYLLPFRKFFTKFEEKMYSKILATLQSIATKRALNANKFYEVADAFSHLLHSDIVISRSISCTLSLFMRDLFIFHCEYFLRSREQILTQHNLFINTNGVTKSLSLLTDPLYPTKRLENSPAIYNLPTYPNGSVSESYPKTPFIEEKLQHWPIKLRNIISMPYQFIQHLALHDVQKSLLLTFSCCEFSIPGILRLGIVQALFNSGGSFVLQQPIDFLYGVEPIHGLLLRGRSSFYFLFGISEGQNSLCAVREELYPLLLRFYLSYMITGNFGECSLYGGRPVLQWKFKEIFGLSKHLWLQKQVSFEVFTTKGWSFILICDNKKNYKTIFNSFSEIQNDTFSKLPPISSHVFSPLTSFKQIKNGLNECVKAWEDNRISNFNYLLLLNKFGLRSYSDYSQYFVIPWVVGNFLGDKMPEKDFRRDLSKPMGQIGEQRIAKFEQIFRDSGDSYFYGTHYMHFGVVLYYMFRMDPFCMFSVYLHHGWDHPNRIFFDIKESYNSAAYQSPADVKEQIPQLITVPELYSNISKIPMKKREDVVIAEYSKNPRDFVMKMMKYFEDEETSKHLSQWIDLIFGKLSRGDGALQAKNIFHPLCYPSIKDDEGIDELEDDDIEREAAKTCITNFGQCPPQLFKRLHSTRNDLKAVTHLLTEPENIVMQKVNSSKYSPYTDVQVRKNEIITTDGNSSIVKPKCHYSICVSHISHTIITWQHDPTKRCHDMMKSGDTIATDMSIRSSSATGISPDGLYYGVGQHGGSVIVYRLIYRGMKPVEAIKEFIFETSDSVRNVVFSPEHFLVFATSKSDVDAFSIGTGRKAWSYRPGYEIYSLCVDDRTAEVIVAGSEISVLSISGDELIRKKLQRTATCVRATTLRETTEKRFFVVGHVDGTVSFWTIDYETMTIKENAHIRCTNQTIVNITIDKTAQRVVFSSLHEVFEASYRGTNLKPLSKEMAKDCCVCHSENSQKLRPCTICKRFVCDGCSKEEGEAQTSFKKLYCDECYSLFKKKD